MERKLREPGGDRQGEAIGRTGGSEDSREDLTGAQSDGRRAGDPEVGAGPW